MEKFSNFQFFAQEIFPAFLPLKDTLQKEKLSSVLSMLIVEKREDIRSFRNMGASDQLISRIFLYEGWLIAFWGIIVGIAVGLILCLIQQHFGLLRLGDTPGAYIVEAYPVVVKATDILIVFVSVSIIGFLAILYPIRNLKKYLKNDRIL